MLLVANITCSHGYFVGMCFICNFLMLVDTNLILYQESKDDPVDSDVSKAFDASIFS